MLKIVIFVVCVNVGDDVVVMGGRLWGGEVVEKRMAAFDVNGYHQRNYAGRNKEYDRVKLGQQWECYDIVAGARTE